MISPHIGCTRQRIPSQVGTGEVLSKDQNTLLVLNIKLSDGRPPACRSCYPCTPPLTTRHSLVRLDVEYMYVTPTPPFHAVFYDLKIVQATPGTGALRIVYELRGSGLISIQAEDQIIITPGWGRLIPVSKFI